MLSSRIISAKLSAEGIDNSWKDSRELIVTDSEFGNAKVDFDKSNELINGFFKTATENVVVLPGFIASDTKQTTTTLGRGGSDYTAAILAAALDAKILEIWTDVSGMMTADPTLLPMQRSFAYILPGSDGAFTFWRKSDLSANHSASA